MKLTQQHYPTIEIDNREPDIIQIWQNGKEDSNVIQIEREAMNKLIELLRESKANTQPLYAFGQTLSNGWKITDREFNPSGAPTAMAWYYQIKNKPNEWFKEEAITKLITKD